MKASFLLSIAALLATAVNAIPHESEMTKDLELQDDFEDNGMELAEYVTEHELSNELEVGEDLDFTEEAEDEVDAFGRRRRRCVRHCRRMYRHCRKSRICRD